MLVSVSIENWMSFRDNVTFSMIASKERQHGGRVPKIGKYQTRILPIAALFGANASGKTNFCKALKFARLLVVDGTRTDQRIPVEPFKMTTTKQQRLSRFRFELLIDETMYEFSFAVNAQEVAEERLVMITSTSEKVLYHRHDGTIDFEHALRNDKFLQFAFRWTRENQLFLTNSVTQNVKNFQPVFDWFKHSLVLVAPDSRLGLIDRFTDGAYLLNPAIGEMLRQLDTGIVRLGSEEFELHQLPVSTEMRNSLQERIQEGGTVSVVIGPMDDRIILTRRGGELIARKLVAYHRTGSGDEVKFEINQESEGTKWVIDVLPAFLELSTPLSKKVYVIDEMDRSLHPILARRLLEYFLTTVTTDGRAQLIFTTHDALLMDQKLLRRDEMWIAQQNTGGESTLISFNEFKDVRYDKDIRKSYLQGRLGGIPIILVDDQSGEKRMVGEGWGEVQWP